MNRRRNLLLGTLAVLALPPGRAQGGSDARVKARLVFNLARFTTWPPLAGAAGDPLVLALASRDAALHQAFGELEGQAVNGRPLKLASNPAALPKPCHLLYLGADAERGAAGLLAAAAGQPVLTLGDGDGFVERGMVALVNVNDAIRFDVHLGRLRAVQLSLNSQVLRLARTVRE